MLTALTAITAALTAAPAQPATARADLLVTNVTLIDMRASSEGTARLTGRAIWISNGQIARVAESDSITPAPDTRVIDGTGTFAVPGLWDMHVHVNRDEETLAHVMFPLMITQGVTGARDMESDCWEPCTEDRRDIAAMRVLQTRLEREELLGPRLLALSSAIVWGPDGVSRYPPDAPPFYRPQTPEEARELVTYLDARGVDFIKVYTNFPREPFLALMREANRVGLPVSGHLPWSVTPEEAARAGMRTIEHARWPALACGPEYEAFRAGFEAFVAGRSSEFPQAAFLRLRDTAITGFDETRCRAILRTLATSGMCLVPTHGTRQMDAFAADPEYRADPRRRYIPELRLRAWNRDLEATAAGPPELLAFYRGLYELGLRVTGIAHEEGVTILTGTDTMDTHAFPGFSLHDELKHMVRAGLSPLAALQAGTLRPAQFLGMEDRYGTLEAGKAADLVLLDADPLEDIRASARIHAVVIRGRYLDRKALDAMIGAVDEYASPELADLPLDESARASYIGEYACDGQPNLTVFEEGAELSVRWEGGSGFRILHQGDGVFVMEVAPDLTITFPGGSEPAGRLIVRRGEEEAAYRRRE